MHLQDCSVPPKYSPEDWRDLLGCAKGVRSCSCSRSRSCSRSSSSSCSLQRCRGHYTSIHPSIIISACDSLFLLPPPASDSFPLLSKCMLTNCTHIVLITACVHQRQWSPAWTLQSTCLAILVLLDSPDESSPLVRKRRYVDTFVGDVVENVEG